MRTIEIIVDARGAIRLETRGFTGATCLEAARRLAASLGQPLSERLTREFYSSELASAFTTLERLDMDRRALPDDGFAQFSA